MRRRGYQLTAKGWAVGMYKDGVMDVLDADGLDYEGALNLCNAINDRLERGQRISDLTKLDENGKEQ